MSKRTARYAAAAAMGLALLAPAGAAQASSTTPVTPSPPVFKDACGTADDEVVIPFTQGVDYYMSGVKVNAGVREINPASPRVEIFTRAQSGYGLTASATWSHTYDDERGCDGDVYVKTGNVESKPSTTTNPTATTGSSTTTTTVVKDEEGTTTQTVTTQDGELPRTGFASDVVWALAGMGLLGAGGLAAVNRFASRREDDGIED